MYHATGDKELKTTLVRRISRRLLSKGESVPYQCSKRSYSQCGEDMIVEYIFRLRGVERPSYIDVGANHPFALSNTARFYERGCRGVNIDPNPAAMLLFDEHRNGDVNLNVGISDKSGEADLFLMEDSTLNTFSAAERDHLVSHGHRTAGVARVKLTTLRGVIDRHCIGKFPDFMSLDVEGMELPILRTIDFDKCFPKVICIEVAEYSPIGAGRRRTELADFLVAKGYFEYAHTNLNAIMVRNEFWFGPLRASDGEKK
jgi:FkbM family methyltransferase